MISMFWELVRNSIFGLVQFYLISDKPKRHSCGNYKIQAHSKAQNQNADQPWWYPEMQIFRKG